MPEAFAYGRLALEFTNGLNKLNSIDAVPNLMKRVIARHGFEMILLMGCLAEANVSRTSCSAKCGRKNGRASTTTAITSTMILSSDTCGGQSKP